METRQSLLTRNVNWYTRHINILIGIVAVFMLVNLFIVVWFLADIPRWFLTFSIVNYIAGPVIYFVLAAVLQHKKNTVAFNLLKKEPCQVFVKWNADDATNVLQNISKVTQMKIDDDVLFFATKRKGQISINVRGADGKTYLDVVNFPNYEEFSSVFS